MQIIAVSRNAEGADFSKAMTLVPKEAAALWNLYKSNQVKRSYSNLQEPGAVLFMECRDVDEAKEILGTLPLMENKLIDFEYFPIGPYTNWDALI